MPGQYWVAKWGDFVDYESVLESKWLMLLDFDQEVTAFATQPLEFDAIDARGAWQHTPDVFARRRDGSALLLDVKNPEHRNDPKVRLQEERTRRTCGRLGWDYAMVSEPSAQRWVNIDLLSSARRPQRLTATSSCAHQRCCVLAIHTRRRQSAFYTDSCVSLPSASAHLPAAFDLIPVRQLLSTSF
jgi:hypothetical protein